MQAQPGLSPVDAGRAGAAVVSGAALLFVAIHTQDVAPVGSLTRDPTVTAEEPWYLGFASSLGVLGWTAATACLLFGAVLVHRQRGDGTLVLALGGAYSLLLAVDDLFLLHDDILLRAIGSEEPVYAVYAILGLLWMHRARRRLTGPTTVLLMAAVTVLASSVLVDLAWDSDSDLRLVTEDGLKFAGIWLWAVFALAMATLLVEQAFQGHDQPTVRDHDVG